MVRIRYVDDNTLPVGLRQGTEADADTVEVQRPCPTGGSWPISDNLRIGSRDFALCRAREANCIARMGRSHYTRCSIWATAWHVCKVLRNGLAIQGLAGRPESRNALLKHLFDAV